MPTRIMRKKTKKGEKALRQHIKETRKIKLRDKMIFKAAGYKQDIILENPVSIVLEVNNKYMKYNPSFLGCIMYEIEKALKTNGAEKETDYNITTDDKKEVK